jgi:hypothetical protein
MSDHLKTPLANSLNAFASKAVNDTNQLIGKALPCSVVSVTGSIVKVKFEINSDFTLPQVTMPLFGPIYIRYPIQPGDKGLAIPGDAYLGGMSGLGGGVADLTQRANLSTLTFLPIGNTDWSEVDPNAVTIYGPNGVVLRDTGSGSIFTLTPTSIAISTQDSFKVTCGSTVFEMTPAGWSLTGAAGNLQDGAAHTSPEIMNLAWSALTTWINSHTHTSETPGTPTSTPITPFTGTSIAPT